MRLINNKTTFITDEDVEIELPEMFRKEGAGIRGVIELKHTIVLLCERYVYDTEKGKKNIICINKQSKELEWIVDPCFEWKIKDLHQYMDDEATAYEDMYGLVECQEGKPWQIEVMYIGDYDYRGEKVKDRLNDRELYELREEYTNTKNYSGINIGRDNFFYTLDTHGLLIESETVDHEYKKGEYEVIASMSYDDLSHYPQEECLIAMHAGAFWYELDFKTGKALPAFIDKRKNYYP